MLRSIHHQVSEIDHFIGIDVGTSSARACLIDSSGEIKSLATENIRLWQPATGYYVSPPLLGYLIEFVLKYFFLAFCTGAIYNRHLAQYLQVCPASPG